VKGETQQLEQLPDTFVSARDTRVSFDATLTRTPAASARGHTSGSGKQINSVHDVTIMVLDKRTFLRLDPPFGFEFTGTVALGKAPGR